MSLTKYAIVTRDSHSDFNRTKKAEYYDELGEAIADESNKGKLKKPVKIPVRFKDGLDVHSD
jgi:hypothetical protein